MARRRLLALAMTALAGCAAPTTLDDPIGVAFEADGARPVIDFPFELAPPRQVPTPAARAFVTGRDDGSLALWVETSKTGGSAVKAIALDRHGSPLAKSPLVVGTTEVGIEASIAGAACAPVGECAVIWSGPRGTLRISTLDAEKTLNQRELAASIAPASIAYDADAGQFLVALNSDELSAFHFAKGKVVESFPFVVAPGGSTLEGVDCAPGHGCLVTFEPITDPGATDGVIVDATGAGASFSIASRRLQRVSYGDGVYFTVARTNQGYGVVRVGLDGAAIDAEPIPILDLGERGRTLAGAAFDGEAFTAIATTKERGAGGRVLADGSVATPATFELDGFGAPLAFACGDDGGCAAIVGHDAAGDAALSALTIDHGVPAPNPVVVAKTDAGQSIDASLTIGDRVFVVWSEGNRARGRWFASEGGAVSAVTELGAVSTIAASPAFGDAGLLVVVHTDGLRATRVVTALGVGPEVPFELAETTRPTKAPFAWLDGAADGSVRLIRFDAEGRALDAKPIELVHRPALLGRQVSLLARAGDLFVVATRASSEPAASSIIRVHDTGEIVGTTRFTAASLGGLACSTSACVVALRSADVPSSRDVLIGRLPTDADDPPLAESKIADGEPGPVVFDGRDFLAAYTTDRSLVVARLDGDVPRVGLRQRDGDDPLFFNATAPGRALLFSQVSTVSGSPPHPLLLADASFVLVDGFGTAASSSSSSGTGPMEASGGACALAPSRGDRDAVAALLVAAAAVLARARRRRACS